MNYEGNIQLILGPMFSGKSSELIRRITRYELAKKRCVLIKYAGDQRYDAECVSTHDKQVRKAHSHTTLWDACVMDYEVIGIDEGQFFPDIVAFCDGMANRGKTVIVSALDSNFRREPFKHIDVLIPLAEDVVKLKAVCMLCCNEASFSKRITDETEEQVIGGSEKYVAVCRRCYHVKNRE
jgi:thymidine kinase